MWDLVIAGLGPAGSTAARTAANHGLKVLALDRAVFPRYKPCAAGITGRTRTLLPLSDSEYVEQTIHTVVIHLGANRRIPVTGSAPMMVTTKRETLDTALVQQARAAGAVIREDCRVRSVRSDSGCVELDTSQGVFKARFVIGCDGVNSVARKGLHSHFQPSLPAWEAEVSLPDTYSPGETHTVHFDLANSRRGYGWIFPKRDVLSIGVAGNFKSRNALNRAFIEMLKHVSPEPDRIRILIQRGHLLPLFRFGDCLADRRILLAGDAGGLVDTFLGEGLYYAVASGKTAAEWVAKNISSAVPHYHDYQRELMRKIGRDLIISKRLASIVYTFPGTMFHLAKRHPGVLKDFSSALSNDDGYYGFIRRLPLPWRLYFWNV